ncbi:TMEM175 family protein [Solihabitans fulvus]|uniref:TMEM175 family protein n=1 Tax=Solihabitans fulvus TaxID=1892852 RepID=UPI001661E61D|nr:TMEM175 family protein [Solihabitans fulvus]
MSNEITEGDEHADADADFVAEPAAARRQVDAGRLFALSDGVFAIASTLLALDLRVPESFDSDHLGDFLASEAFRGTAQAYVIGYLVIAILWVGHHRQFRLLRRISSPVSWLNLLFLGLVAVLPFPTSLMSRFGQGQSEALAIKVYASLVAVIFLVQAVIGFVALRQGVVRRGSGGWWFGVLLLGPAYAAVGFGLVILVLTVFPGFAPWWWTVTAVVGILARPVSRWITRRLGMVGKPTQLEAATSSGA